MATRKAFFISLCMFLAISCAYITTKKKTHLKSYTINVEEQATVGVPMITSELIKSARVSRVYDLTEWQGSWQTLDYPTKDSYKEELVYTGRTNSVLHILYKKYGIASSTPQFSQKLTYDLETSDIMEIRNFKIKVLNATGEYIRFQVLSD